VRHPCQREFNNSQIIIYIVDSEDRNHIADSRKEFFDVMSTPGIQDSVVLVIANKQDLENCMSVNEVREKIGFEKLENVKYKTIIGASLTNSVDLNKCLSCVEEQYRHKLNI
jgi:signal recognition particle receptor subunit beta